MSGRRVILVNATASQHGGSASIITSFLSEADHLAEKHDVDFFVFLSPNMQWAHPGQRVTVIYVDTSTILQRMFWDLWGIKRFCRRADITPLLAISFQNTGMCVNCMQLIYVHQSLPFTRWKKWRWWNRQERTTWFYRYIYGFAMRISFMIARDYKVAVQAEWIKDCIVNFFGICALKIVVIKPRATIINDYSIKKSTELLNCDKINFFYPASGIIYKNHSILFAALAMLKVQDHDLFQRINIILTLGPDDRLRVQAEHLGINEAFTWAGYISHATCFDIYRNARCLLFPSFVETVGLPLLEAAACGMPVIASDLPFSRDTLAGYTAVTFARFDSAQDWMDSIRCTATAPATRAKPHRSQDQGDWSSMIAFAIGGEAC